MRFASDALVSAPGRWEHTLKTVRRHFEGRMSEDLGAALAAIEEAFRKESRLDRGKVKEVAQSLIGDTKLTLSDSLAPRPAAGYALMWSLGEPAGRRKDP